MQHPTEQYKTTEKGRPSDRHLRRYSLSVSVLATLVVILFISSLPAAADELSLTVGNQVITGYARQVPLGEVLGRLSDQTGCEIYIDQALYNTPVTFDMPVPMPTERAVRRMVHPYSNAMVYEAVPGTGEIRIQQIKVFQEGGSKSQYVRVAGHGGQNTVASYARGETNMRRSSLLSSKGVSSGMAAVQRNVKPALSVERGALGLPRYNFQDKGHGPDYRPDVLTMRKAYADYRQQRTAVAQNSQKAMMLNGRLKSQQAREQYQQQRLQAIKKMTDTPQP